MNEQALFDALAIGDERTLKKLLTAKKGLFWGSYLYDLSMDTYGRTLLMTAIGKGEKYAELVWNALLKRNKRNYKFWYAIKETLMYAFSLHDADIVSFLLRQNVIKKYNRIVDKEDRLFAQDLVYHAVSSERFDRDIVLALLKCGLNFKDKDIVNRIITYNDLELVQELINHGVKMRIYADMRYAARCSNELKVLLLDNDIDIKSDPFCAAQVLAALNSPDIVDKVLEMGISVNTTDENGNTPLMLTQSALVFRRLLEWGAYTGMINQNGDTVWKNAAQYPELTEIALEYGMDPSGLANEETDETALIVAAQHSALSTQILVDAGADVDAQDNDGNTAIILSAYPRITDILIKAKANVNLQNNNGTSALMMSVGSEETKLLLAAGANPNLQDNEGSTVLMFDAPLSELNLLLEAKANANIQDNKGLSPLMTAKNMNEVKLFLSFGAKIDLTDDEGNMAIHYAVSRGDYESVRLLLRKGSPYDVENDEKMTPIQMARQSKKKRAKQIVDLLEQWAEGKICLVKSDAPKQKGIQHTNG